MGQITFVNVGLALVGLLIYTGIKLQKLKREKKRFSIVYWLDDNWIQLATSLFQIFILLFFAPVLVEDMLMCHVHQESYLYEIFSFWAGFSTHALWHELVMGRKKLKLKNG